jgi:prophage regulatory protein
MAKPLITPKSDDRVLSTKELLARIPFNRSTIWKMVREGRFPKPIQLSPARIGWRWSAIVAWLDERERDPLASRSYFGSLPRRDRNGQ